MNLFAIYSSLFYYGYIKVMAIRYHSQIREIWSFKATKKCLKEILFEAREGKGLSVRVCFNAISSLVHIMARTLGRGL